MNSLHQSQVTGRNFVAHVENATPEIKIAWPNRTVFEGKGSVFLAWDESSARESPDVWEGLVVNIRSRCLNHTQRVPTLHSSAGCSTTSQDFSSSKSSSDIDSRSLSQS